ncbi:MAG TPA: hypothetical protein VFU97_24330 [Xanthobacteraceae bacterium]|nr:hypothetical protein [Xanthobacteraceae bacterium]
MKAILASRKTQTRRICPVQPVFVEGLWQVLYPWGEGGHGIYETETAMRAEYDRLMLAHCRYGRAGDRLWVRETWDAPPGTDDRREVAYRADYERDPEGARWRPAIHMPRWASRITLDVLEIRVERLHDITEEDAKAEGVKPFAYDPGGDCWTDGKHRTAFSFLWNEINGWNPNSWDSNPWVWVVSFRRVEKEIIANA